MTRQTIFLATLSLASSAFADAVPPLSIDPLVAHNRQITRIAGNPNNPTSMISIDESGRAVLWDLAHRRIVWDANVGKDKNCYFVAFSNLQQHIAIGSYWGKEVRLVSLTTGETLRTMEAVPGTSNIRSMALAFSPDDKYLAAVNEERGHIEIWSTESGKHFKTLKFANANNVALAFSPDGEFVSAVSQADVRRWSLSSTEEFPDRIELPKIPDVYSMAMNAVYTPDLRFVAIALGTVQDYRTVAIVDTQSGKLIRYFKYGGAAFKMKFSSDLCCLSVFSADGSWSKYEIASGEISYEYHNQKYLPAGSIWYAGMPMPDDFSADLQFHFYPSPDGKILVWKL